MATITTADRAEPVAASPEPPPRRRRPPWPARLRQDGALLVMVAPVVVLTVVFAYVPMLGIVTSFQFYNIYDGFWASDWIGLTNFRQLLSDPTFWQAFENTLVISAVQLVLYFPIPIALAILLDSVLSRRLRSFIQAVVYLPHFFSWVLVVTIFQQMLGGAGVVNQILRQHDLGTWNIMTNPGTFKYLVTAQAVWKDAGWGIIIFLAALAAIDRSLYETAASDGAGRWRRLWHVTLPGLRNVIVLMLVLRLGNALTVGFEQMLIQRFAVGRDAAEVLDTFAWYRGVVNNDFGFGAAAGLFKGVLSLGLILAANRLAHAFGEDGLYRR